MISGVCSGLADYFGIDATIVRIVLIAVTLLTGGTGILLYVAAVLVVPDQPQEPPSPRTSSTSRPTRATATSADRGRLGATVHGSDHRSAHLRPRESEHGGDEQSGDPGQGHHRRWAEDLGRGTSDEDADALAGQ